MVYTFLSTNQQRQITEGLMSLTNYTGPNSINLKNLAS